MKLSIKKLRSYAKIPTNATSGSAGYDLYAAIESPITISSGDICSIPTGIAMASDCNDIALMIYARSGLASRHGIALANGVGIVDSDYRGEIIVPLINLSKNDFTILPDMRIAQLVITPIIHPKIQITENLENTNRGINGFGSTGL